MDSGNWRPAQNEVAPPVDGGDWRSQIQPESRQRIVNKIMETLKRHLPFSGEEGLQELKQIAIRFEEKIYSAATSQSDYLRKISLKMLTMDSKSQSSLPNAHPNALPSNFAGMSRNQQDSGGGQPTHSQSQSWQQLMSQLQSQLAQLKQQLALQQPANSLQQNMQPQMQNPNSLLEQQPMIDQQKQLFQSQRAPPEAPSSSLDSTAQTGGTNAGDWQEDTYLKIKSMKEMYFADLNDMYQKISMKLQQHEALPQQLKMDQLDKLRMLKNMLEKLMQVLQTPKSNIQPSHRDKLSSFEKQITGLLSNKRTRRPPG